MNGCGKTTILNITEAIITGQLFKLFNYNFKDIILKYIKSTKPNNIELISINLEHADLIINFNNQQYINLIYKKFVVPKIVMIFIISFLTDMSFY